MLSKDGEVVSLVKAVPFTGQVESWLNGLVNAMRLSLRHLLHDAISIYDEKSKDQWIWDYPAQVALTASQVAWNAEVNTAFKKQEEGYENALKDLYKKLVRLVPFILYCSAYDYLFCFFCRFLN